MTDLLNGIDPTAPGQVVAHCSEADGAPDVGISIGLGSGKTLWIGTLLSSDGGDAGVAVYDGAARIAVPFEHWDEIVGLFSDHIAPAITDLDSRQADTLECMIYDAHLPSMTARFRIPEGLPFASGMYEIRRIRRPTAEDIARWAHLPEPPNDDDQQEEQGDD
ncbi:hypothetical protein [Sphingomonas paucimobilis]|uniref:hypothetical protein n=1 Tax=Sphingomonas paucimobilis TaxID=13689 RepID=UPI00064C404A|nr:hypothetical protein [Sphingomonas paucimobilis]